MKDFFTNIIWFWRSSGKGVKIVFFAWLAVVAFGIWVILRRPKPSSVNIEAAIKTSETKLKTYNAKIDSIQKIGPDSIITDVFGQYINKPNKK